MKATRTHVKPATLSCDCTRGYYLCPEAARLWGVVRQEYDLATQSNDYSPYYDALEEYDRHFLETKEA